MHVEELPGANGHVFSQKSQFSFGGSASNFAAQSTRLGVKTGLVSCIGDDLYGQLALKNLSDIGVDTKPLLVLENQPTGLFFLAEDKKGSNVVFAEAGANGFLEKYIFDDEYLARASTVHIAGGFPMMTKRVAEITSQEGLIFSLDPGRAAAEVDLKSIIKHVDILFVNSVELKDYFGIEPKEKQLRDFAKTFPGILVVKMGREGAIATDGFEYCSSKIFEVPVVDTLGAGDSFAAGFITSWTRAENIEQGLTFANAVASCTITQAGAQIGQPTLEESLSLLSDYRVHL
jgi:sugar/nucleoside kinase (ribokinase family)